MIKYRWLWLAALLVLCSVLYWPGLHGPFLFDDFPNLAALDSIDHVGSWRDLGIYLSQSRSFPGRPLAMLSFLMQKADWPDHPFPFKLVNLCLHLICGVLVYRLTNLLAQNYADKCDPEPLDTLSATGFAGLLAAAAWLLNPIQISGVLLVVQRMTLLMAFFTLLGLLAYLKGLLADSMPTRRRGVWIALGIGVGTSLAFLSKENGILLPLFALVLDTTLLRANVSRLPRSLRWWRRLLIWPPVLFVLGYLLFSIPQSAAVHGVREFSLGERLLTEPRVLFDYLSNIFLPRFGLYGLYHDGFAISQGVLTPWTTLPALIGILGMATLGLVIRRRHPLFAMAILWYLGGQLIESTIVLLELYFEHRNYVPIIGPFMAIAIGLTRVRLPELRRRLMLVTALWLLAAAFTTALSVGVYSSADRLALAWASKQPDSVRAQGMLVDRLYQHGQLASALAKNEEILEKHPDNAGISENSVYLKCMLGSLTDDDLQNLQAHLRTASFDLSGFSNIKNLRLLANATKCPALNAASWQKLTQTLLANPRYTRGVAGGFLHYQLHELAVSHADLGDAIRQLDLAYADDPDAEIPRLQAKYLASAGLYDQAIKTLQDTDYSRLPLLRRLLVNDRAINDSDIQLLEQQEKARVSAVKAIPATATTHRP